MLVELTSALGGENVSRSEFVRLSYAGDTFWLPLYLLHRGIELPKPDFVVFPNNTKQVSRVLKIANEYEVPVIPWGGGSGTQGGVLPIKKGIVVDMKKLNTIEVNEEAMTVTAQAGVFCQELEWALNENGLTTGHYPASMYCATLGGMLAARSAGVMSTKYGKVEDMVLGLEVVLPTGEVLDTGVRPKFTGATGPDLNQLFVGSEGTLGIITKATLQVHPMPEERRFRAFSFRSLHDGYKAILKLLKKVTPCVIRLYDEEEVRKAKYKTITPPDVRGAYLILGFDGFKDMVELEERTALEICLGEVGFDLGKEPGEEWWRERFLHYYPPLSPSSGLPMIYGTVDVAATFDRLENLYLAIKEGLRQKYRKYALQTAAHFSHWSKSGGMVYIRFYIFNPPEDPDEAIRLHDDIWATAMEITAKMRGVINDHHGIGLKLGRFMKLQYGQSGMEVLRRIKEALDPKGIMNPGKLGFEVIL